MEGAESPFNQIERRICGTLTMIGIYSKDAVLNPGETCELPVDDEENKCLIFNRYPELAPLIIGDRRHHLLLCLEIFRSEMLYAMENGSVHLFEKLKAAGHYPYSDLDREPVV